MSKFVKRKNRKIKTTQEYKIMFIRLEKRFHAINKKICNLQVIRTNIVNEIEKLAIEIDQRPLK